MKGIKQRPSLTAFELVERQAPLCAELGYHPPAGVAAIAREADDPRVQVAALRILLEYTERPSPRMAPETVVNIEGWEALDVPRRLAAIQRAVASGSLPLEHGKALSAMIRDPALVDYHARLGALIDRVQRGEPLDQVIQELVDEARTTLGAVA